MNSKTNKPYGKPALQKKINEKSEVKPEETSENQIIKKGIIYVIEHNDYPNFKYIGQTIDGLNKRWMNHLSTFKIFNRIYYRLCFFVNYYNVEKFSIREYKIYNNITQEFLDNEEKKYIYELGTLNTRHCNDTITIKINDDLRNELIKKIITQNINISKLYTLIDTFNFDYKRDPLTFNINDENQLLLDNLLKKELSNSLIEELNISKEFLEDHMIIEDFIKYIEFFNKEFEITNNKDDIYYSSDLLFGLEQYGEENELFDYYLMDYFSDILQKYFNIINKAYNNVNIILNNNIIYGIKKKIKISFKLYHKLRDVVLSFLEQIDYNEDCDLNNGTSVNDIFKNKLFIEDLDIYTIWHSIYIKKIKYDKENKDYDGTDEFIIFNNMDYSYDYNNLEYISNNLILILEFIIKRYNNIFKIVDNTHIMVDNY